MDGLECPRTAGLARRAGSTVVMMCCTFYIAAHTVVPCRQAMCRCAMGGSASIAQRGAEFQRNAKLTFQMWQNQGQPYSSSAQPPGDIPIPQLLRKSTAEPPAVLAAPGAHLHAPSQSFLSGGPVCCLEGVLLAHMQHTEESAERDA